jgi:phosphoserine phosphatase
MSGAHPDARLLVTVTGRDHPGITAALTAILAASNAAILDMQQVAVQGRLSLSIVLAGDTAAGTAVLKDLLFAAKELGSDLDFRVLGPQDSSAPARAPHVLTLLADESLSAAALAAVSGALASHGINIEKIVRLSESRFAILEMTIGVPDDAALRAVRADLMQAAAAHDVDIALQAEGLFRRAKRLVVFDLDSTLVRGELIDVLGAAHGAGERVAEVTRRAMGGQMDFATALRERVGLLAGMPLATLERAAADAQLMPGAAALVAVLRRLGFRTAIVSGGFAPAAEAVRARLGIDWAYANELEIENGALTGRVREPILDAAAKARIVRELAGRSGITLDEVIAVGDGANDLPMLEVAGLGIAFNAHAVVRERARHHLNRSRLDSILFLLGISERDVRALQSQETS